MKGKMYKLCSIKLKWCNDFPMVIDKHTKRLEDKPLQGHAWYENKVGIISMGNQINKFF
jgi:hypothetical protein